jgi:Right handed beta helix region
MGVKISRQSTLGVVALFVLGIGAMPPEAWAAAPTAISGCPYTITDSGSYILTKNLTSAGTCIIIEVSNVTIDLQGHTITGDGTGFGITDGGNNDRDMVIANGTIQHFGSPILVNQSHPVTISGMTVRENAGGVALFSATVFGSKIDDNAGIGIRINGDEPSAILNSEVSRNGGQGIVTLSGPTIVVNSEVSDNALDGIALSVLGGIPTPGNQVIETQANGNGGNGIDLSAEAGNSVIGSTAQRNAGTGIILVCPGVAISNTARHNGSGNLSAIPGSAACANIDNAAP